MADIETQVQRALDSYKSAVLAKNADTLMHLYDRGVRVFDMWGTWSLRRLGCMANHRRGLVLVTRRCHGQVGFPGCPDRGRRGFRVDECVRHLRGHLR
jgi:hypothetical protein